jgi:glycosyltransferase involved in cell wall biosynthesis
MLEDCQIAVVVPAYNEEKLIGRVLETMPAFVDLAIVIDDCSRDGTVARVQAYAEPGRLPYQLMLLQHQQNQGVGASIKSGYRAAAVHGADVVAVMAGDAQMDPDELARIVGPVVAGQADYVKGNRLFSGEAWNQIPRHRYLGNAFLSLLTKIASGYWQVADSQTGYTAISRKALEALPLDRLYARYGYPNHLLVMLNIYSFRVMDVPVRPVYHIGEVSGIRLHKVIPTLSWLLLKGFLWRLKEKYVVRDFHPLIFFYAMGAALGVPGLLFGLYLLYLRLFVGPVAGTSALFAVFLAVTGMQALFLAMWMDMEYNRGLR